LREEKQSKINALESTELGKKTDKEIYLEAQANKRERYFKEFKKKYGIPANSTMEILFAQVDKSKDAFDDYIEEQESIANENEYFDVTDGGDGAYWYLEVFIWKRTHHGI